MVIVMVVIVVVVVVALQRGGVAIVASEDFNNLQLQHGHSQCVLYRGVPLQSQCAHAEA